MRFQGDIIEFHMRNGVWMDWLKCLDLLSGEHQGAWSWG